MTIFVERNLKIGIMTTKEIYNLANELTEKEVSNVVNAWFLGKNVEALKTYNSLLKLGDSVQLACASAIAEIYNQKNNNNFYINAYEN